MKIHRLYILALSFATGFSIQPAALAETVGKTFATASAESIDLGGHSFRITTKSDDAQRSFDRGLTLAYAFSHLAAEDAFRRAVEADPDCAMAWWGIALVNGPHINFPAVPEDRAERAVAAIEKAQALAGDATELERALIAALSERYRDPQPENRAELDEAYAVAMRKVLELHPKNADAATFCAEALMDMHPWDLWKGDGSAQPWTEEIVTTIELALELNPDHPGANHLYIHAIEASPNPAKALASADRLRDLVPGASHLVHMPAHIYARLGRWTDAAKSNEDAMKADKQYRSAYPRPGFYAMYMAHNTHFLAFTSMMRGRSTEALELARDMVASMPEEFLRDYTQVADGFTIFPSEVLMRFGRWEEVLAEPAPRDGLPFAIAMWHFTRTAALTALDRTDAAKVEREAFETAAAAVPKDWTFGNNIASDLLAVAAKVLDGEMAARAGRFEEGIALLRDGVKLQDGLNYDEPPDWIQPVRHTLGAALLRAHRPAEAEKVYLEDLAQYPENGWSLFGLGRALREQGKTTEASGAEARFAEAWSAADIKIDSTCHCLPDGKITPR